MNRWPVILLGLLCTLLLSSCRKNAGNAAATGSPPQVGSTYCLNDGEGGYRAAKVLAVEDEIVFVLLFGNRWTTPPTLDQVHRATRPGSLAYSVQSFAGMQPTHLENGTVSPEDLEAYETWKTSKREVF